MKKRLVIITGVSCSGKTTLQNELLKWEWKKPYNFTTRKPRTDNTYETDEDWDYISNELNEYTFITKEAFNEKRDRWEFLETSDYGWNNYGVSKILPEWNICVILDPIGKTQVLAKWARWELWDIDVECFFIECSKEEQLARLTKRWDSPAEIEKRQKDYLWFKPQDWDIILDWWWSVKTLAAIVDWAN